MKINFGEKKLGFGVMRLPMLSGDVGDNGIIDTEQTKKMFDEFMNHGFNYFDTAHGYIGGKSEKAVKECLTDRYKRDDYFLTNKLSGEFFTDEKDIIPLFENQLETCGVSYFDLYLMHAINGKNYYKFLDANAFAIAARLRSEGKIRHIGISYHDSPELLEKILTDHPEIETVQIQFNYRDYEDAGIQSRAVWQTCVKFNKPVIVMEPVKGGKLAKLPYEAEKILSDAGNGSPASYAVRFAASHKGVAMVLSGMSNLDQLRDNIGYMENFVPLSEKEKSAVQKAAQILASEYDTGCTACHYCAPVCPQKIKIPELLACLSSKRQYQNWNSDYYYSVNTSGGYGKASSCVRCGRCENVCPQNLKIRNLLDETAKEFEMNLSK